MNPARMLVVADGLIVAKEIEMRVAAMGCQVVESALLTTSLRLPRWDPGCLSRWGTR